MIIPQFKKKRAEASPDSMQTLLVDPAAVSILQQAFNNSSNGSRLGIITGVAKKNILRVIHTHNTHRERARGEDSGFALKCFFFHFFVCFYVSKFTFRLFSFAVLKNITD